MLQAAPRRTPCSHRYLPISLGRGACLSMALTPSVLDTSVTWKVKDKLAMFLERLPREDLREEVRWIRFARNVLQLHAPSAAQLAHLE